MQELANSDTSSENRTDSQIHLGNILYIFAVNLKTLVVVPFLAGVVTAIYVLFIAEQIYISSGTILPLENSKYSDQLTGLASRFDISIPGAQVDGLLPARRLYPELIKSRSVAQSLLTRKFDTNEFGPGVPLLNIVTDTDPSDPGYDSLEVVDAATKVLVKDVLNLIHARSREVFIIEVSTSEPHFSKELADIVIAELDKRYREYGTQRVREKIKFIDFQANQIEKELSTQEDALAEFQQSNEQFRSSPSLSLIYNRMVRDIDVKKQILLTMKRQYEMAKIEEVEQSNVMLTIDHPEVPLNRAKPKRTIAVLLAGFIGGLLAVAGILFKEFLGRQSQPEKLRLQEAGETFTRELSDILRLKRRQHTPS